MYRALPKHRPATESDTSLASEIAPAQEQKLSAMGPLQYTRSPLQGSASPPPPAGNPHTLPLPLQNGIAALSGYDMRSVRVHRNSTQPAQHGALAFAQGQDIHLGPGQEQHLPHEAWHLVQQAQGRVQANMQMAGVAINDDPALEHEADLMGRRALQYRGLNAQAVHSLGPGLGMQRKVMQKMSTQITLDEDDNIEQVVMRGRPPRAFSNSMGDHTTAFVVHQEGLAIALEGQSLPDAVKIVSALADKLESLPGYKYMQINDDKDDAGTNVGKRFLHEYQRLQTNLEEARKVDDDTDMQMHYLQQAINYYLGARELVPFSTINVGEKSKGLAGRGHGESKPISVLSNYERAYKKFKKKKEDKSYLKSKKFDEDQEYLNDLEEELPSSIPGLFDFNSSGTLAVERNPFMIERLVGDISFEKEVDDTQRLEKIWKQHQISIESNFQFSWEKSKDKLQDEKIENIIASMRNREFLNLQHQIGVEAEQIVSSWNDINKPGTLKHGKNINQKKIGKIAAVFRKEANLLKMFEDINELNLSTDKKIYTANIQNLEKEVKYVLKRVSHIHKLISLEKIKNFSTSIEESALKKMKNTVKLEKDEDEEQSIINRNAIKDINDLKLVQAGSPLEGVEFFDGKIDKEKLSKLETVLGNSEKKKKKDLKLTTLTSAMAPLSTQVTLNEDGTVAGLNAKGRPASPFSGTMGAHTTAWVTHLDRVNRLIKGKGIDEAIEAMQALGKKVNTFAKQRGFKGQGDNSKYLYADAQEWMNDLLDDKKTVSLQHLQSLISAILSFYNLIPGVSLDKIDTRGKGEAKYRRILLNYEAYGEGSKEELLTAIKGLFDSNPNGMLYDNHLSIIADAYPDSYAFAIKNGEAKKKIERPKDKVEETDEDDEDDYTDEQTLSEDQIKDLKSQYKSNINAWNVNNCLINAITDAAGIDRATEEQVINIRTDIGAAAGEMLFASPRILDRILNEFGLQARGVLVLNIGSPYTDQSTGLSGDPLFIYHDGINHFQALIEGVRKSKLPSFGQKLKHLKRKRNLSLDKESSEHDPKSRKLVLKSSPVSDGSKVDSKVSSDSILIDDKDDSDNSDEDF